LYDVIVEHNTVKIIAVHKKADWHVGEYNTVQVVVQTEDVEVAYKGSDVKELEEGMYRLYGEEPGLLM
jgi:hypothetical protein